MILSILNVQNKKIHKESRSVIVGLEGKGNWGMIIDMVERHKIF